MTIALAPKYRTPYHVSVFRATKPMQLEYYPIALRDPLPTIKIPLRPDDADVTLGLQELIALCHQRGRYDDIDYRRPLEPPPPDDDAAWIDRMLREKQLR